MKRNVKITMEYDGTRYKGWQKLSDNKNTIQGKLENILERNTGEFTQVIGSGRTDAGVHARGQVANFHLDTQLSPEEIQTYINTYLPEDIVVKDAVFESETFHSRYHAKEKTYSYHIHNHPLPDVFKRHYSLHVLEELNLKAIETAMEKLCGTHDFMGFSSLKKTKKSTVRTLYSLHLEKQGPSLRFVFRGNGFLLHSIRIMTGTLLEVGMGQRKPDDVEKIFTKKVRRDAGFTVPAQGLFLEEVRY